MTKTTNDDMEKSNDFRRLIELQQRFSQASAEMQQIEAAANKMLLNLLDEAKPVYARLQKTLTETETEMETLCRNHPEWFEEKAKLKTPYGEAALTKAAHLEAANPGLSLALIKDGAQLIEGFEPDLYIRRREELNLEALAALDDATLKRLRITRVVERSFSAKPAKVNMGKAVKEAAAKESA